MLMIFDDDDDYEYGWSIAFMRPWKWWDKNEITTGNEENHLWYDIDVGCWMYVRMIISKVLLLYIYLSHLSFVISIVSIVSFTYIYPYIY